MTRRALRGLGMFAQRGAVPAAAVAALSRRAMVDVLGLACYIVWSFAFWNGPLLPAVEGGQAGMLLLLQGIATSLAALAIALGSGLLGPEGRGVPLLVVLACVSTGAVALAALGREGGAWTLSAIGFVLSGAGSCLRLGWEERISVQGVRSTCIQIASAYLCGYVAFGVLVLLPHNVLVAVVALLPLVSLGMFLVSGHASASSAPGSGVAGPGVRVTSAGVWDGSHAEGASGLAERMGRVPWRLLVLVALTYFCYGATRTPGVAESVSEVTSLLVAGLPMISCFAGIVLAYFLYCRHGVLSALYVSIPLIAVACLLNALMVPYAGTAVFLLSNLGAELIKYLAWFLLIDAIIKDGASALLCIALLRCFQWGGSVLGQVAHGLATSVSAISIVMLAVLVIALLVAMGTSMFEGVGRRGALDPRTQQGLGRPGQTPGDASPDSRAPVAEAGTGERASVARDVGEAVADAGEGRTSRIERVVEKYGLSPREAEVLAIWSTGRSCAYLEKRLFISHGTAKTHLTHIYAKTHTANREELLELIDGIERG